MSDRTSKPKAKAPRRRAAPSAKAVESSAKKKRMNLWHMGALFHVTNRYPRKKDAPRVDRRPES